MSKYFTEQDIDNYRQCFKLYAPDGVVTSAEKLGFIMRSLDLSPTGTELVKYYETYRKEDGGGGVIDFAEFLNIIHVHLQAHASPSNEILAAFKAYDVRKSGYLTAKELRSILTSTGERLTNKDVDLIIQEVNGAHAGGESGRVSYEQLLRVISSPIQFK